MVNLNKPFDVNDSFGEEKEEIKDKEKEEI